MGLWAFGRLVGPTLTSLFSFLLGPTSSEPLVRPELALELVLAGSAAGAGGQLHRGGALPRGYEPAVLLTLLLGATAALAQDEAAERAAVREQLATQRAALALIESKKVSVLEGVELLEQMAAFSRKRVQVVEKDLTAFRKRVAAAEREEAVARRVLQQQLQRLTPRLRAMYRLTRRQPLEVLLTSEDFSSLVWRARTLEATMKSDLELLRAVQHVARLEHQAVLELRRLQSSLAARQAFLKEQVAFAQQQQAALKDVVATLTGRGGPGRSAWCASWSRRTPSSRACSRT